MLGKYLNEQVRNLIELNELLLLPVSLERRPKNWTDDQFRKTQLRIVL
jgi:hypothetical protein